MDDCRKCQTFAASPAEPGELLFLFSEFGFCGFSGKMCLAATPRPAPISKFSLLPPP